MKFRDMLRMSLSSLWKRKVRTFLTVLGVVVGTASIVVMISLGLGLSRASMAEIEKYGGITTVTVTEQDSYTVDSSITEPLPSHRQRSIWMMLWWKISYSWIM